MIVPTKLFLTPHDPKDSGVRHSPTNLKCPFHHDTPRQSSCENRNLLIPFSRRNGRHPSSVHQRLPPRCLLVHRAGRVVLCNHERPFKRGGGECILDLFRKRTTRIKREMYRRNAGFLLSSKGSLRRSSEIVIVGRVLARKHVNRREQRSGCTSSCAIVQNRANMNPMTEMCRSENILST